MSKDIRMFWKDIQTRAIIIMCVLGSIVTLSFTLIASDAVPTHSGRCISIYICSSTTGWQTSNMAARDDSSLLFIVFVAMVVGGAAGATVGGIKVIRALLLQKGLRWQINKVFLPKSAIKSVSFNYKRWLPEDMNAELARAAMYTILYLVILFICTVITVQLMPEGFTLADALFETTSAQSTVGLSNGITDPSMNPALEIVFIIQMLAGRLEIIPLLVLARIFFFGTKSRML
ncbi:MAG: TrkH family potassium uptake protein [Crocinitomicaceae bacterium]|nr:TrkH family potassium uptake protein [Crocinitomicaceae bacterium]